MEESFKDINSEQKPYTSGINIIDNYLRRLEYFLATI